MTINFIHEAIASFKECQRIIKHPTNEAEYLEWVIPFDDGSITKTWTDVQTKAVELETEWNAKEYARKRKAEYPTIEDLIVALYDTDDKSAIEAKRAEVKAKYPKP